MMRSSQCHSTARQNKAFDIGAEADQIFDAVPMVHPHHVLLDDGTVVEILCHVMSCRTDEFDAALLCPSIRRCPDERGQKRMMNVDRRTVDFCQKLRGEDLHVACQ